MPPDGRLAHPALLYADVDSFVGGTVPFLRAGIEDGEEVFAAVRVDYLEAVRDELGDEGSAVRWEDTRVWHPHHASRLRAFWELISGAPKGRSLRLVGEPVWPERLEDVREWQRYESALNAVLAPFAVSLMCLYDAGTLDPSILEAARRTHPTVTGGGTEYVEPEEYLLDGSGGPPSPPPSAEILEIGRDLATARGLVLHRAIRAGVEPEVSVALSIATNEIATNALLHGGGEARLAVWIGEGRFVCQLADRGEGIEDPLAGYRPPGDRTGGRGLWLARQLVELMEIASSDAGTTVTLYAPIA